MEKQVKKYSRRIRMYRDEYLSVCIYLTVTNTGTKFYDTVIYRKIKTKSSSSPEYVRGTNLKPKDIPVLVRLLAEANDFLNAELSEESLQSA